MGEYASKIAASRGNMTQEEIYKAKCQRSKTRNEERKRIRREAHEERIAGWNALTKEQKLRSLDLRPGQCKKERERLNKS